MMTPNPYTVLGIPRSATPAEIAKAVPAAMKARQYPPQQIARAQKMLMDPIQRMVVEFLTLRPAPTHRPKRMAFTREELEAPLPHLERSTGFDRYDELIQAYALK